MEEGSSSDNLDDFLYIFDDKAIEKGGGIWTSFITLKLNSNRNGGGEFQRQFGEFHLHFDKKQ